MTKTPSVRDRRALSPTKATKLSMVAVALMVMASGCLTSQEPFYQESDIRADDRLVGSYGDENDHSQPPTRFYVSKVSDFDHQGQYYVRIISRPGCEMKFGAVFFQIGTNRFLDMLPVIEGCDHLAANPPSLIELLQSVTLQPFHVAVKVDATNNGVKLAFVEHPRLAEVAQKFPQYFQPFKPGELPRLVSDTAREREFLLRFGSDTNIFKVAQVKREAR